MQRKWSTWLDAGLSPVATSRIGMYLTHWYVFFMNILWLTKSRLVLQNCFAIWNTDVTTHLCFRWFFDISLTNALTLAQHWHAIDVQICIFGIKFFVIFGHIYGNLVEYFTYFVPKLKSNVIIKNSLKS